MMSLVRLVVIMLLLTQPVCAREGVTYPFVSDVPGVEEAMLSAPYWLERLDEKGERMSPAQIAAFNRRSLALDDNLWDLAVLPDTLSGAVVGELIAGVSRPATSPRYLAETGEQLTAQQYGGWQRATNIEALAPTVKPRWGLVTRRASLRSYPTSQRVLKKPGDIDLDRFQESAVFPGEQVAVLHTSTDKQWLFVLNYHYGAWVRADAVALGAREQIEAWVNRQPRLVITGARVATNYNPQDERSSRLPLEMGVSLPLVDPLSVGFEINGQNPYTSYIIELPLRAADGSLEFAPALIARSRDVQVGHMPYTAANVLTQAFKFLGERYGWGHDYDGRDCTGFVGEVYKSFGIVMPRNTGQQARSAFAPTRKFIPGDETAVRRALGSLQVGDLIYTPGHVVMFIGHVDGEPWVIHDKTVLEYRKQDGTLYSGTLSSVAVTPLLPLMSDPEHSFLDSIYAIKHIALAGEP